jgi:hypothetical protein
MTRGVSYATLCLIRFLQFFLGTKSIMHFTVYLITRKLHLLLDSIFGDSSQHISEEIKQHIYHLLKVFSSYQAQYKYIPKANNCLFPVIQNVLCRFIGPRPAMFLGCTIFSVGTALTYFTLEQASGSCSNESINRSINIKSFNQAFFLALLTNEVPVQGLWQVALTYGFISALGQVKIFNFFHERSSKQM